MAGKFKNICTAFPLSTFLKNLRKKLERLPLKIFDRKNFLKRMIDRKSQKNCCTTAHWKISLDTSRYVFFFSVKFLPKSLQISFFNEFRDSCWARWCKSSSRHEKGEMTNGWSRRQNKISFRNGFKILRWPWNTVSTNRV